VVGLLPKVWLAGALLPQELQRDSRRRLISKMDRLVRNRKVSSQAISNPVLQ